MSAVHPLPEESPKSEPADVEAAQSAEGRGAEPRVGADPRVSVVVASNRDRGLLDACLASLLPQCERVGAELIVARAAPRSEIASLARALPTVKFVAASHDATIPQLRGLGMRQATGDLVALTEDHCKADERWVETLLGHASNGADVLGGGMDNAQRRRAVDWAAYFAEYGFFDSTRPEPRRGPPLLSGANVAYKRRVIDEVVALAQEGNWENVAHDKLLARGSILRFVRTAAVSQNASYSFGPFCVDRYRHGRDYARKRLAEGAPHGRWVMLAASPLLPLLLTWRVAKSAGAARVSTFVRALPATFAFLTAWSIGEAVGYLLGPARDRLNDH